MSDNLKQLLSDGIITQWDYNNYILFELTDLGKVYLKNTLEAIFLEPTEEFQTTNKYAWKDGRFSFLRDIKISIEFVKRKLEKKDDRSSGGKRKSSRTNDISYIPDNFRT